MIFQQRDRRNLCHHPGNLTPRCFRRFSHGVPSAFRHSQDGRHRWCGFRFVADIARNWWLRPPPHPPPPPPPPTPPLSLSLAGFGQPAWPLAILLSPALPPGDQNKFLQGPGGVWGCVGTKSDWRAVGPAAAHSIANSIHTIVPSQE